MSAYEIIDEPKVKKSEHLIVNPIMVLFVAIFLPLFWMPPYFGRWWLPLVWLTVNGYLLGSPSLIKEIMISIVGLLFVFGLLEGFIYISQIEPFVNFNSLPQYASITLNGAFFFILYLVVFKQSVPYGIYVYLKRR